MAEYIEREALKEAFKSVTDDCTCPIHLAAEIDQILDQSPAADVAPVSHGQWKYYRKQGIAVCTKCSFERKLDDDFGRAVSCPNCCAKMDGDSDG